MVEPIRPPACTRQRRVVKPIQSAADGAQLDERLVFGGRAAQVDEALDDPVRLVDLLAGSEEPLAREPGAWLRPGLDPGEQRAPGARRGVDGGVLGEIGAQLAG